MAVAAGQRGVPRPVWLLVAAVCLSYGGYEFVRAASVSLFLSGQVHATDRTDAERAGTAPATRATG